MKKVKVKYKKQRDSDKKAFVPNKFSPTFEILKQIDDMSKQLPQVPLANRLGGILKSRECIVVGSERQIVSRTKMINHKIELINSYRKFGEDGIGYYLAFVSAYQAQVDDAIKKEEIANEDVYKENIRQFNSQI
mgnify:CR=1 FL=1